MHIERPLTRRQDVVQGVEVFWVGVEPCIHVITFQRDDAADVAGGQDLWRWLVGDEGEGVKESKKTTSFQKLLKKTKVS